MGASPGCSWEPWLAPKRLIYRKTPAYLLRRRRSIRILAAIFGCWPITFLFRRGAISRSIFIGGILRQFCFTPIFVSLSRLRNRPCLPVVHVSRVRCRGGRVWVAEANDLHPSLRSRLNKIRPLNITMMLILGGMVRTADEHREIHDNAGFD